MKLFQGFVFLSLVVVQIKGFPTTAAVAPTQEMCSNYDCFPNASNRPSSGERYSYSANGCTYESVDMVTSTDGIFNPSVEYTDYAEMKNFGSNANCPIVVYPMRVDLDQNGRQEGCDDIYEGDYVYISWGPSYNEEKTVNSCFPFFYTDGSNDINLFYRSDNISGTGSVNILIINDPSACVQSQSVLPPFDPVLPGIDGCEDVTEESILMEVTRIKDAILKNPNNITEELHMFGARETECYCYGTCISKDESERQATLRSFYDDPEEYTYVEYLNSPDFILRVPARKKYERANVQSWKIEKLH